MDVVVWADGSLRGPEDPVLTAVDHGVTVGDGVFETCCVVQGQAFALTRHLERLRRSALGLGLEEPDLDLVRRAVEEVLATRDDLGRVRITLTAGLGPLGSGRLPAGEARQSVMVLAAPAPAREPARVATVPWTRNERSAVAGLKTTSYAENVVALGRAHAVGADEAVLANTRGELCEGTGSNVFVERGGELVTPPLSSGCLAGITRALVLEWAAEEGLPVREARDGELGYEVLQEEGAGFALTGSVRGAVPILAVDGREVAVGPVTREVCAVYDRREAQDVDP